MNPLQGIRGVPVALPPLKTVAPPKAAPILEVVTDQVVLDGAPPPLPPPISPAPVEDLQLAAPALPKQPPSIPSEIGGFLVAGSPQTPSQSPWEVKTNSDGSTYKQRLIEPQDGGPKWREIVFEGHPPYQKREVKAEDGGPDWTQMRFPDQNRPGYRERKVAATDGGPEWLEKQLDGKSPQKTRTVPATDGGNPWNEVSIAAGSSWKSRQVAAEDGGKPWTENIRNGVASRQRCKACDDGKGDWCEVKSSAGHRLTRKYTENGTEWKESINGQNRFRTPALGVAGLAEAAAALGTSRFEIDGLEFKIHGAPSEKELGFLRKAIENMPPAARVHAQDISLADSVGEMLTPGGEIKSGVGGLAAGKQIALKRGNLTNQFNTNRIVFHEAGHVADTTYRDLSNSPPWGRDSSVTTYGQTNPKEDFAETHRVVLADFERYSTMTAAEWACESQLEKKLQIATLYAPNLPTLEQVKDAENTESMRRRERMQAIDLKTEGNEGGRVIAAGDGGAPWVEMLTGEQVTGRTRPVPASDGGPNWTEFQLGESKPFQQRHVDAADGGPQWVEKISDNGTRSKFRTLAASDGGPAWTERMPESGRSYKERKLPAEDGGPAWQEVHHQGGKPFKHRVLAANDGGPNWNEYQPEGRASYKQREVPAKDGGAAWKQTQFPDKPLQWERPVAAKDGGPAWTDVAVGKRRFLKRQVVESGVTYREVWEQGKMNRTPV